MDFHFIDKNIGTVHSVNNCYFATKDLVLGWCVSANALGLSTHWLPLNQVGNFTLQQLKTWREIFSGPLYPEELRQAIDTAMEEFEKNERQQVEINERINEMERERIAALMDTADAGAVSPIEMEIKTLKVLSRRALSRAAIYHLRELPPSTRVALVIAMLKDCCLELDWREIEYGQPFLMETDCPVVVKRPEKAELVELLDGLIPFMK